MENAPFRLLAALPQTWLDGFVGAEAWATLSSRFESSHHLDPATCASVAEWQRGVASYAPHVLLTGWKTPPIPLDAMPPLRLVAHTAGSVRGIVPRELIERGLLVTNWGSVAASGVAECALMLVLCCLRRTNQWALAMHRDRARVVAGPDNAGVGLYGRRVGIHGVGHVARCLIRLLAPFGCRVRAYSAGVPAEVFRQYGIEQAESLEALFATSDVVVEAEALTDSSRGSVTEPLLRALPAGGAFVNVGRGAVVDERALERVAAEGRLQIGLDVYDVEPLPVDSPLRGLPNVMLLPHVAGPTRDQRRDCGRRAVEAVERFADDLPIEGAMTLDAYDRST